MYVHHYIMERGLERVTNANAVCRNAVHTHTREQRVSEHNMNVMWCFVSRFVERKKIDDASSCFLQVCISTAVRLFAADVVRPIILYSILYTPPRRRRNVSQ